MTRFKGVYCLLAALVLVPLPAAASDHADPILYRTLEGGLTGLFAFQDGDDLVVILTMRRKLLADTRYDNPVLEKYEYTVHFDLDSLVAYNLPEHNRRYGGRVRSPAGIEEDLSIKIRLDEHANFQRGYPVHGDKDPTGGRAQAGIYDDPFIFPRFSRSNVIGVVLPIPLSYFPEGQQDWLIWATSSTEGLFGTKQVDHVGRSARTQLGRFEFLNPLHPSEHVAAIKKRSEGMQMALVETLSKLMSYATGLGAIGDLFKYVLLVRPAYDYEPDVMIFTTRTGLGHEHPESYPNGRRLEDDIVGLTCEMGDCVLQEVALYEGSTAKPRFKRGGGWPRATEHDPPFTGKYPYLLPPHETPPGYGDEAPNRSPMETLAVVLVVLVILWLDRNRRKADAAETPYVRKRTW